MTEKIKANVGAIRKNNGLSREQVADMLEVDLGKVKRLEWGKSKIDLELLESFASALNMTLLDVITYPEKYISPNNIGLENDSLEANILIKVSKGKGDQQLKLQSIEIS
jgi:transcriptional regulator with XRE-family HTH domain